MIFHFSSHGVSLRGKGIVKKIHCTNIGKENVAIIEAGASLLNCSFYFKGNNNKLHIKCGTHLRNASFHFEDDDNKIIIGESVTSEPQLSLAACESCSIIIGNDCMISNDVQIRTTDSHSVVDADGKRINHAGDITIGNHVWIGFQSLLLKGTTIPDNCVIGARSMTTASLKAEQGDVIAGTPAKVIKHNINWRRERI